jgi:integrase
MAIRQKGTKWQVDVTVAGIRAPRVSADTKAEAYKIEADFKAKLLAGVPPEQLAPSGAPKPLAKDTLGALMDATMRTAWAGTKGEATAVHNAGQWVDELGADFPLADLTLSVVADVADGWAATGKVQASTINRKLSALSKMMSVAVDRGMMEKRFKVPYRKEYEGRLRYYSDAEVESLLLHAQGVDFTLAALFALAVDTGMRLGELQRLTVRDYDRRARRLTAAETKADRTRSVPLTATAMMKLDILTNGKLDHQTILPAYLTSRHISRVIAAWKADRGLPASDEACFHTFRHTTCSRLMSMGVPINSVMKFMGHSVIETTMRYSHLAPDSLDLARDMLERKAA